MARSLDRLRCGKAGTLAQDARPAFKAGCLHTQGSSFQSRNRGRFEVSWYLDLTILKLTLGAFARELATGKRPYEEAIAAGYPDGSCARRNAQKRTARADVKALVAELRAPIAKKLEITLAVLIERAIYRQAMLAGQFNAAISAPCRNNLSLETFSA
jgi:hypothetical protein